MRENNSADAKVSEGGGRGGAPDARAEIFPPQPTMKTMGGRLSPCSPWRSMVEQISICSPWKTPGWSRCMPEGVCDPVESLCWSRLLPGPVDLWRERSQSKFAVRACDPVGDPIWSSLFLKDCTLWEGLTSEKFVENCLL